MIRAISILLAVGLTGCATDKAASGWPPAGYRPIASTTVTQWNPEGFSIKTPSAGFGRRHFRAGIMTQSAGPPVNARKGKVKVVREEGRVFLHGGGFFVR